MGKDCSLAIKTLTAGGGGEEDAAVVVIGDGRVGPAVPGMPAVSADNSALLSSMLSESQRKQEEMQRKTERLEERLAYLENVVMRGQAAVGTSSSSLSPAVVITHHSAPPSSQVDEVHPTMDAGERSPAPHTRAGERMTSAAHFLIMAIGNDGLAFDFHETFFGMNPENMCPHPYKRGLVTKEQADVAFQV
jgi:hypothetical protein